MLSTSRIALARPLLHRKLATHKLRGEHEGKWAFSFGYDARVVFVWQESTAVLLDVGSHDEVYG